MPLPCICAHTHAHTRVLHPTLQPPRGIVDMGRGGQAQAAPPPPPPRSAWRDPTQLKDTVSGVNREGVKGHYTRELLLSPEPSQSLPARVLQ